MRSILFPRRGFTTPPRWAIAVVLAAMATPPAWPGRAQTAQIRPGAVGVANPTRPTFDTPSDLTPAAVRPDASLARPYSGAPISVTTFHYDNNRTGWNPNETDLTVAAVQSGDFGVLAILPVDSTVWGEPLLVAGYTMADGSTHDVLIVATGANSVYAFDAQTYAQLWHVKLGPPQVDQPATCPGRSQTGVNSTPVIGPGAPGQMIVYVVASEEPSPGVFQTQLRALDLGSGADTQTPAILAASETLPSGLVVSYTPYLQYNHAALALNNGKIYIGVGANCEPEADLTGGWLFQYDTSLHLNTAFPLIGQQRSRLLLGGVWMAGFAPAIDGQGNVYVTTGNGETTLQSPPNWGDSLLKLAPDLSAVIDRFTPANYVALNKVDGDFSSGGVMLLPTLQGQSANPMVVTMGKYPTLYLLDQTNLGGLQPNDAGAVQAMTVGIARSGYGVWGGPAFYNGPNGPEVYYQPSKHLLSAYQLSTGPSPSLTLVAQGTTTSLGGGSSPVVSSNGAIPGTGIVWLIRRSVPAELEAYDAINLGEPIFRSALSKGVGISQTPLVANGRVYVGLYAHIYVFGLVK